MADQRYQVILHDVSGIPKDDYVNVLYFNVNFPDTEEGTCDGIHAAYVAELEASLSSRVSGMTIKVYDMPAVGEPVFAKDYTIEGSTNAGPNEVAICLSYTATDNPAEAGRRHRGRIYIGPLSGSETSSDRPQTGLRTNVLDFGEALASIGFASNTTWLMWSSTLQASQKIEAIWVDDAWDTQRRRGLAALGREVRDVQ
jgi:hypothetical protein